MIQFALHDNVSLVIGVDKDETKLNMLANNAKIYNVPKEKLVLIHADVFHVLSKYCNGILKNNKNDKYKQEGQIGEGEDTEAPMTMMTSQKKQEELQNDDNVVMKEKEKIKQEQNEGGRNIEDNNKEEEEGQYQRLEITTTNIVVEKQQEQQNEQEQQNTAESKKKSDAVVTSKLCRRDVQNDIDTNYKIGGIELLPNKIDKIFLSPPWGGLNYDQDEYDLHHIQINASKNYENSDIAAISSNGSEATIDTTTTIINNNITNNTHMDNNKTNGKQQIHNHSIMNGEQLLQSAIRAAPRNAKRSIAYYLPKSTNGLRIAESAYKVSNTKFIDLEQNVMNGKLKTITAYFDT